MEKMSTAVWELFVPRCSFKRDDVPSPRDPISLHVFTAAAFGLRIGAFLSTSTSRENVDPVVGSCPRSFHPLP